MALDRKALKKGQHTTAALAYLSHDELVLVGVEGRLMHLNPVLLQHVQESCLAGIVQTQEEDLRALVVEPCTGLRKKGGFHIALKTRVSTLLYKKGFPQC